MSLHSFYNQSQNDFKGQYNESFIETRWPSVDNQFSGISCCPNKLLHFSGLQPQFIFPSSKYAHYVSAMARCPDFTPSPSLWHVDWRSSPSLGPHQSCGRRKMCAAFVGFLELPPRSGTDHFLSSFLTKANIMIPSTTESVLWLCVFCTVFTSVK